MFRDMMRGLPLYEIVKIPFPWLNQSERTPNNHTTPAWQFGKELVQELLCLLRPRMEPYHNPQHGGTAKGNRLRKWMTPVTSIPSRATIPCHPTVSLQDPKNLSNSALQIANRQTCP